MSLRHGLLGLLAEGPASGYDLARRFTEVLGSIWPAQHPKIYAELGKLAAEGLVEVESEGPRRRKAYRITDAGVAEVKRWLTEVDVDHTMRLQPLLRSLFFWLMDTDDLQRHLQAEARYYRDLAQQYRELRGPQGPGRLRLQPADPVPARNRRGRHPPLHLPRRLGRLGPDRPTGRVVHRPLKRRKAGRAGARPAFAGGVVTWCRRPGSRSCR